MVMNDGDGPATPEQPLIRRVAHWLILCGGAVFGCTYIAGAAISMMRDPVLYKVALDHFPVAIGLPSAVLPALCIVVFLESSSGPIEFEGLGFKFKGASGPIVLLVFCFLAMAGAIKLLY
jgi:hypothetical protein